MTLEDSDLHEDDGGEEEEEHDDAAERAANSVQTPPRAPDPVPGSAIGVGKPVDRTGKPRARKKKDRARQEAQPPRKPDPEKPREADLLWPYVMQKAEEKGVDPSYVDIRVARVDVGRETTAGYLGGDAVLGDDNETPSEALYNAIVEHFHMRSDARGPVLYNVTFSIRGDRGFSYRGQLKLPSPAEIQKRWHEEWYPSRGQSGPLHVPPPPRRARRREEDDRDEYRDRGRGRDRDRDDDRDRDRDYRDYRDYDRRGLGGPPPQYAPQYPPRGYDDSRAMREELRELRGLIRDLMLDRAAPQQPQTPQQQQDWDQFTNALQRIEKMFGVKLTVAHPGLGAAPQPGTIPVQVTPAEPSKMAESGADELERAVHVLERYKRAGEKVATFFGGRDKREEEEEEEEEPKPEPSFKVIEVPGMTYPGTEEPIRYAEDLETGEIDGWKTLGLQLPIVMHQHGDKALEVLGKFADAFKGSTLAGRGRPQMPAHAEGMNGIGVGHPPPYQPPQQQAPQQPKPPDDDDFRL